MKLSKVAVAVAVFGPALITGPVVAQEWPEQPITVVVPFNAGGATDLFARNLAPALSEALGQPVNVINQPGAGGQIGTTSFLQRPDDGYTMMITAAAPYLPNNILVTGADYTLDDFAFINAQWIDYTIVAVPNDSPFEDFDDLITAIKSNPGELSTGVTFGSAGHINTLLLLDTLDIPQDDIRIVTFDGGAEARTALAGGQVDFGIDQGEGLEGFAGEIRPLAVFLEEPVELWDAPLINDALEPYDVSVPILNGSVRTVVAQAAFRDNHPEAYEKFVSTYEALLSDEDYLANAEAVGVGAEWRGPDRTTQIVEDSLEIMSQYSDLMN
jgi:putative tricarboxylic transport membrane protein